MALPKPIAKATVKGRVRGTKRRPTMSSKVTRSSTVTRRRGY